MNEQKLFKVSGTIMGLGESRSFPQRTQYQYIWIRESEQRETTIRKVSAAPEVCTYLVVGNQVTLYFVQPPSDHKFLFAIDCGPEHADGIDLIGRDQAKAFRSAIIWLILSVPLCLVLVGFLLLGLTIRGLILLARAPKPAAMRAFVAAHRPA